MEVLASDPSADPAEVRLLLAQGIKSLLMLPIADGDKRVGLLELYRRAERPWSEGAVTAARAMSQQLEAVIERLRRLDRLNGNRPPRLRLHAPPGDGASAGGSLGRVPTLRASGVRRLDEADPTRDQPELVRLIARGHR